MKRSAKTEFPMIVTKGSASVKIYRTTNRGKETFTLSYVGSAGRVLRQFRDLDEAKREAGAAVASLAKGDMEALKLTGHERQMFVAAAEALKPTGVSLDIAAREFAAAFEILGRDSIIEAARYYHAHVSNKLEEITVAEAVARFTEAKTKSKKSALYLKDIRLILGRFAHAFSCLLRDVSADEIGAYLSRLNLGPVATNNHRRLIVGLFEFAKKRGWLHKTETTAAEGTENVEEVDSEVEIYSPAELAALISAADADFLPWLVLIAFGGLRREELAKGLQWEDIDFARCAIVVPANIAKTKKKRKIIMPENLREWLAPYRESTGPIFPIDPRKRMAKASAATGVTWKKNALRHSFGSYRMEATKNAGQVALEMGNSPAVVLAHYHEIVHAEDAAAYWAIRPAAAGNVVQMKGAA